MNALVRVTGIRVASRTSAFRARQDGKDLPAIARALSVNHVLEGSVRTAGSRLRVTAQLTDVASGFQLWSERFDREAADVFAVQDEIAAGVVEAVKARLAPGRHAIVPRPQPRNLEAYQHYLRGRHLRYTKNDVGSAARSFEQAIGIDPEHAPSWVGLAEVKVLGAFYLLLPAREAHRQAKDALATAARLQGETATALYVEGMIAFAERDWPAAERLLRRALELEPHHVPALCRLALLFSVLGRPDDATAPLQLARDLDPLSPWPLAMTGLCLLISRRPREAGTLPRSGLGLRQGEHAGAVGVRAGAGHAGPGGGRHRDADTRIDALTSRRLRSCAAGLGVRRGRPRGPGQGHPCRVANGRRAALRKRGRGVAACGTRRSRRRMGHPRARRTDLPTDPPARRHARIQSAPRGPPVRGACSNGWGSRPRSRQSRQPRRRDPPRDRPVYPERSLQGTQHAYVPTRPFEDGRCRRHRLRLRAPRLRAGQPLPPRPSGRRSRPAHCPAASIAPRSRCAS